MTGEANSMSCRVNKTVIGLSRVELIVVLGIVVILLGLLLPLLARTREVSRATRCEKNLKTVGKAVASYRENNIEYFPFSWGPADVPEPRRKDALASLGCLHLGYLPDATVFRCPATLDEPRFQLHLSKPQTETRSSQHSANWVLVDSSYGYDCRVDRRLPGDHPIVADMDGTYMMSRDTDTQNHVEGQNVLFVDGSVEWMGIAEARTSGPGWEDIYAEDPWHADTDAFISDNTFGGKDRSPAGYDDLGPSYDAYPSLHPKPGPVADGGEDTN